MKRILLGLMAVTVLLVACTPAMANGYRYGVRVYGAYPPYYAYRPYYGPAYYPPPRVYYPPYPVYGPPAVGGFYRGPGFGFYFGR